MRAKIELFIICSFIYLFIFIKPTYRNIWIASSYLDIHLTPDTPDTPPTQTSHHCLKDSQRDYYLLPTRTKQQSKTTTRFNNTQFNLNTTHI